MRRRPASAHIEGRKTDRICGIPGDVRNRRGGIALPQNASVCFIPAPVMKHLVKNWLPAVLWMGLIVAGSSDLMSSRQTSRILGPLLHWLIPDLSEDTCRRVIYTVRKCAHVAEYAVLAALVWRARRNTRPGRPLCWRDAAFAAVFAAVFAAGDEFRQSFSAVRQGAVRDVLLDTAGALLGLAFFWMIGRRKHG